MLIDKIEECKENIKPLAKGRTSSMLEKVTTMDRNTKMNYIKENIVNYEKMIKETKDSEDPLKSWIMYVSWSRQIFTNEINYLKKVRKLFFFILKN